MFLVGFLSVIAAHAAPGAHGPDGEHLDQSNGQVGGRQLQTEANSELFELVAQLTTEGLRVFVDRYETNEPVLNAQLEVESGPIKSTATFRAGSGDYLVAEARLVQALSAAGEHGLVFTLRAGDDADLLNGTLVNPGTASKASQSHHDHTRERAVIAAGTALAVFSSAAVVWVWVRRRRSTTPQGSGARA
jgi:hypothetical protein